MIWLVYIKIAVFFHPLLTTPNLEILCELYSIKMPDTFVVHLGNSKDLMDVAEDSVAKRVLREHVRATLGVQNEDVLFAIINSMFFCLWQAYPEILFFFGGHGGRKAKALFLELLVQSFRSL